MRFEPSKFKRKPFRKTVSRGSKTGSYFQLDKKKYAKTSRPYSRANTYFKVVGYNKFVKKYSVAVYVSGYFFDTRMMTGEQIKSFGVKYYSKFKIN